MSVCSCSSARTAPSPPCKYHTHPSFIAHTEHNDNTPNHPPCRPRRPCCLSPRQWRPRVRRRQHPLVRSPFLRRDSDRIGHAKCAASATSMLIDLLPSAGSRTWRAAPSATATSCVCLLPLLLRASRCHEIETPHSPLFCCAHRVRTCRRTPSQRSRRKAAGSRSATWSPTTASRAAWPTGPAGPS